jgi:TonB family protein
LAKGLYVETTLLADGTLFQELVTPEENLQYFDCINSKLCDLWYLLYDTIDYDAHTDPALMAEIRNLQNSLKEREHKGMKKAEIEENSAEPIFVENIELFPDDGSSPAKSFSDTVSGEPPVMYAEEMPEFPGGPDSLKAFLRQNLKWPIEYGCWNGTVLVEFIVEVDGSITHPRVDVSLYKDFDEEALRVVKLMPKWKPARAQGKPVRCYYKVPVTFSM